MQKLALFDLDHTLTHPIETFHRWAADFAGQYGLGEQDERWITELDAEGSLTAHAFFAALRERFVLEEPVEVLLKAYRARLPELTVCAPDVLAALGGLREAGWRVGIVTNGSAEGQEGKIRSSGLAEVADGWAVSGAEQVQKPDARLFRIAAERCGADPAGGGWMIGDDPMNDIVGGHYARLSTIWIDRGRGPWPVEGLAPTHVAADALEAVELLLASR